MVMDGHFGCLLDRENEYEDFHHFGCLLDRWMSLEFVGVSSKHPILHVWLVKMWLLLWTLFSLLVIIITTIVVLIRVLYGKFDGTNFLFYDSTNFPFSPCTMVVCFFLGLVPPMYWCLINSLLRALALMLNFSTASACVPSLKNYLT